MTIPDLQVTAIRCEAAEGWTVVVVEFQWLDAYYGRGQWADAVAVAARAMASAEWRAYWSRPHFVERELAPGGALCLVAVEQLTQETSCLQLILDTPQTLAANLSPGALLHSWP